MLKGPLYNRSFQVGDVLTRIEWPNPGRSDYLPPRQETQPEGILAKLTSRGPLALRESISFRMMARWRCAEE